MPSLLENLIERAQAISDALENKRTALEKQYADKQAELADLEAEIERVRKLPHRRESLMSVYRGTGKQLCPDCSLHRDVDVEMVPTEGGTDKFDVFRCPACGFEERGDY